MGEEVAPRFDLSTEIMILSLTSQGDGYEEKMLLLHHPSAEDLCHLVLTEGVKTVICGGIEEEYYHYLTWKKIKVIDSIIGFWKVALETFRSETLTSGTILRNPTY